MTKNIGRTGPRLSQHINRRVTQSIFRAFDFAEHIGTPLNTYVVLNLRERDEAAAATVFEFVRHKFRDWLTYHRRKGAIPPPTYIFAFESPQGMPHVNWALHVPDRLKSEFERKLPVWVKKSQGECGPFDINSQPIRPSHAKRLAKYIVKGTDPAFVSHFHLQEVQASQGQFWGKRAGVSPSLGRTARAKAAFKPRRRVFPGWSPRPNFNVPMANTSTVTVTLPSS